MARHGTEDDAERKFTSNAMRGTRPLTGSMVAFAVGIALVLGLVGGGLVGYLARGPISGPSAPGTAYLVLTIGFDFATGLDRFLPANFTVPAHTLVVVTITNYDNASNPVANESARVRGTLGNIETMRAASQVEGMNMAALPTDQVAHTFTLDSGGYSVNVPIPVANSLADPMIVTFRAYFNVTGSFEWHCMAPCDSSSMETLGYMRGTMTVVDG
jgi:hypothetical protein